VASLEGLVGVMADIEAHPGVVKVLFQDGASSSIELFKEDTAVSEILEHLGCQGGALKRADGLKYIGSNVVPAGVYQLVRPAPPPGGYCRVPRDRLGGSWARAAVARLTQMCCGH